MWKIYCYLILEKMCNVDFSSSLNIFIDFLQKWSLFLIWQPCCSLLPRTTDTQWRHKSKISENLGWCGRQNMLRPYLNIWDWDWIFGRAVKVISFLGVRSPCLLCLICPEKSTLFFSGWQKHLRFSRTWHPFFSDLPYETQLFLRLPP